MEYEQLIGLDLGTNYTTVSIFKDKKILTLQDCTNPTNAYSLKIPTCISYTSRGILIGYEAQMNYNNNPTSTVFFLKMYIGQDYETCKTMNKELGGNFEIVSICGSPIIRMNVDGVIFDRTPSELYTDFMKVLIEKIEVKYECRINYIVLTVPVDHEQNRQYAAIAAAANIHTQGSMKSITGPPENSQVFLLSRCCELFRMNASFLPELLVSTIAASYPRPEQKGHCRKGS